MNPIRIRIVCFPCPTCQKLELACMEALDQLGLKAEIERETDVNEFPNWGVHFTPSLFINGKIMSVISIPSKESLQRWFRDAVAG